MKITVYVMAAIGLVFWVGALVIPGIQAWMILFAAVLVAWCAYWLMTDDGDSWVKRFFMGLDSESSGDDDDGD